MNLRSLLNPSHIIAAMLGMTLALLLAPVSQIVEDVARRLYDETYPVIEATATVTARDTEGLELVMSSRKVRDCRLLEVQAFDVDPDGVVLRLGFARVDGKQPSGMPPGKFRSSTYRVSPLPKHRLALSFVHECQGRSVRSHIRLTEG